jgi:GT2 family glycosyltransferase
MKSLKASVVVCTYGRLSKLEALLANLIKQEGVGAEDYEILIIDSEGSKLVADMLARVSSETPIDVIYIKMDEPGLSKARNIGVASARGSYLLFTDDDCLPTPDWISRCLAALDTEQYNIVAGAVVWRDMDKMPLFYKKRIEVFWGALGYYKLNKPIVEFSLESTVLPMGANMAMSKETFQMLGPFREDIGVGTGSCGEDTEFFERALTNGLSLAYDSSILVYHDVDVSRINMISILEWYFSKLRFLVRDKIAKGQSAFGLYFWIAFKTFEKVYRVIINVPLNTERERVTISGQ